MVSDCSLSLESLAATVAVFTRVPAEGQPRTDNDVLPTSLGLFHLWLPPLGGAGTVQQSSARQHFHLGP